MVHCACNRMYCAYNRLYSTCNRMYCVHYRLSSACYRLGGWSVCRAGLRAKRATLPGLWWWGARPKVLVFLPLSHRLLRESPFSINTHSIISPLSHVSRMLQKPIGNSDGSPIKPNNSHHKRKKTKTFGLVSCRHVPGRVARFARNPALQKDQPLRGSMRSTSGSVRSTDGCMHSTCGCRCSAPCLCPYAPT